MTEFSALCAEALEAALLVPAKSRDLKVLDRRNFAALAKEWELGMNGYVEDESAKQAGRLLGVDVMLLAKYTVPKKKIVALRATLIETETGQILATAATELKTDKPLRSALEKTLPEEAAPAPAAEPLKVELWTAKADYGAGERFQINVRANQDCHLTLIDVGTSGNVSVLFPNHYAQDNAVKAGVTTMIPDPAAGFEFTVSGPAGKEIIRAIASREPAVDLSGLVKQTSAQSPFAEVKADVPGLTRDIHVQAKKAKPGQWSEAVLQLSIH